jgi:hypothetical protein
VWDCSPLAAPYPRWSKRRPPAAPARTRLTSTRRASARPSSTLSNGLALTADVRVTGWVPSDAPAAVFGAGPGEGVLLVGDQQRVAVVKQHLKGGVHAARLCERRSQAALSQSIEDVLVAALPLCTCCLRFVMNVPVLSGGSSGGRRASLGPVAPFPPVRGRRRRPSPHRSTWMLPLEAVSIMERFLTPSKITAWLDCAAYLDLKHAVESGLRAALAQGMGSFARMLADEGLAHEAAVLEVYRARGLRIVEVPGREDREPFAAWAVRVESLLHAADWDVLYQLPIVRDGICGVADFLLRQVGEDSTVWVEPVDAKLARKEAEPGHVLQLSFYAEALAAKTGRRPERMHLRLGSGEVETLRVADFDAYWQRLRGGLARLLDSEIVSGSAVPEPCQHCAFCEFGGVCDERWRGKDSLIYVAGLRTSDRMILQSAGVGTLAELAGCTEEVSGLPEQRHHRLVTQAEPQRQAREQDPTLPPPFTLIPPDEDPWSVTASPCCRRLATGMCSSTSRATRSGGPTAACSTCSGSSSAAMKAPGSTCAGGRTTSRRKANGRPSSSSIWPSAASSTRGCTSTTTTTPSAPHSTR